MLEPLNKETAAMLVPRPNPPGIQLYYYANVFFLFSLKNMAVDHVSENQQLLSDVPMTFVLNDQ